MEVQCCGMPLCQIDCTINTSRKYSCVYEHKQSGFDAIRCWGVQRVGGFKMPEDMILYKMTLSEQQRREDIVRQNRGSVEGRKPRHLHLHLVQVVVGRDQSSLLAFTACCALTQSS